MLFSRGPAIALTIKRLPARQFALTLVPRFEIASSGVGKAGLLLFLPIEQGYKPEGRK